MACWRVHRPFSQHFDLEPKPMADLSEVVELVAGDFHMCARHRDGSASCWGGRDALGDGTPARAAEPVAAAGLTLTY